MFEEFSLQEAMNLVWAGVRVERTDDALMKGLARRAHLRAGELTAQDLGNFFWGYAKAEIKGAKTVMKALVDNNGQTNTSITHAVASC